MAHFAELDAFNTVQQVIVVSNEALGNLEFPSSERAGINFCCNLYGWHTKWRQTSYNASFRKNYAYIGGTYDATLDAFIPPKPFDSWVLNEQTARWEAPVPRPAPSNNKPWFWDESKRNWSQDYVAIPSQP